MTIIKSVRHEMPRAKWSEIIKRHAQSDLTVRKWCEENNVSVTQFYYWLRVVRQESLIQAGALAVTGHAQFAEIKPMKVRFPDDIRIYLACGHTDIRKSSMDFLQLNLKTL